MKTAICISGIPRGDTIKNVEIAKTHFDADVFYSTYFGQQQHIKKYTDTYYLHDEPEIPYHPLADIPDDILTPTYKIWTLRRSLEKDLQLRERMRHQSKQIFAHDMLLRSIPSKYDMIIRMRYDTRLSTIADLKSLLVRSYENNIAIGFGVRTSRHKSLDVLAKIPEIWPDKDSPSHPELSNDWGGYIMDPLIFHPRNLWSSDRLNDLHAKKSLMASEMGYYQMLSQPYGDSHECYYGGAQIEKYLQGTIQCLNNYSTNTNATKAERNITTIKSMNNTLSL